MLEHEDEDFPKANLALFSVIAILSDQKKQSYLKWDVIVPLLLFRLHGLVSKEEISELRARISDA